MARKITMPVYDDETYCKQGYIVEYKLSAEETWIRQTPNTLYTPVVIENLLDDVDYDVRIARICCDGTISDWDTWTNITTTP